nr:hypothetical protein [uncultured Cohaesibacter sp.]
MKHLFSNDFWSIRLALMAVMFFSPVHGLSVQAQEADYPGWAEKACVGSKADYARLKSAALDEEDSVAMLWLRWTYLNPDCKGLYKGFGQEARDLLERAAQSDNADAARILGNNLLTGRNGYSRAPEQGMEWLEEASVLGEERADLDMAREYLSGQNVPTDLVKARTKLESYKKAYGANNTSNGIERDLRKAEARSGIVRPEAKTADASRPSGKDTASPTRKADAQKRQASNPSGQNTGKIAGKVGGALPGELVYRDLPLLRDCWLYSDFSMPEAYFGSKYVDSIIGYKGAKMERVAAGNEVLTVRNYYWYDVDIVPNGKYARTVTLTAQHIADYGSKGETKCKEEPVYGFSTRDALMKYAYARNANRKSKNENWRPVPLSKDVLQQLTQYGVVRQ